MTTPSTEYWDRIEQLCWMIAHLAAERGYCPRGPLRVMYADLIEGHRRTSSKAGSVGRRSSERLLKDLRSLEALGIVERRDVRVVVTDWSKLHLIALRARAA